MIIEIIKEKIIEWARRMESQKSQSAILSKLSETKDFDKINTG